MNLYVLIASYDEGADGVDYTFRADSREEVATYILKEMQNRTPLGSKFLKLLLRMTIALFLTDTQKRIYFLERTPEELLDLCDSSYPDGDSTMMIVITEIKAEDIIFVKAPTQTD